MIKQEIVWTVLPNGIGKTGSGELCLKLSVFVSPRLGTDDPNVEELKLKEFPDFLNWPEKVKTMEFEVECEECDNTSTTIATLENSDLLDAKLWSVLFKDNTFVRPYTFPDYSKRIIRTYPVESVLSYLKKWYRTVAENSPSSLPLLEPGKDDRAEETLKTLIDDLGGLLKPEKLTLKNGEYKNLFKNEDKASIKETIIEKNKGFFGNEVNNVELFKIDENNWRMILGINTYYVEFTDTELNIYRDIYNRLAAIKKLKVLDPKELYGFKEEDKTISEQEKRKIFAFLQANRFYDRRERKQLDYYNVIPSPPEKPQIDFHQMLATLGDHPVIMRRLGLVLDLVIPVPENPFSAIRLISPKSSNDLRPWTNCIFTERQFTAQPKPGSKLKNRMLDLTNANDDLDDSELYYSLMQVDTDGAALKILDFAGNMNRQIKKRFLFSFPEKDTKEIFKDCNFNINQYHEQFNAKEYKDYVL